MRRLLLSLLIVLMFSPSVLAAPFLICDPQDGVESYTITLDGVTESGISVNVGWLVSGKLKLTDSGNVTKTVVHILKDLADIATGTHKVTAKACGLWGCSADSNPFQFTRSILGAPTSILLVTQ